MFLCDSNNVFVVAAIKNFILEYTTQTVEQTRAVEQTPGAP